MRRLFAALVFSFFLFPPPSAGQEAALLDEAPAEEAAAQANAAAEAPVAGEATPADAAPEAATKTFALITLGGAVVEIADPMEAIFGGEFTTLREVNGAIDRAAADPGIDGIALVMRGSSLGLSQSEEIHRHLMAFRESGKPILAFQDNAGIGDLLVMSAADHVVMPPVGNVLVFGLQAQMYYLKDMLAKLGIEAQSIQTGRYKSAMEMFTHSAMSEDTRTQMTTLVNALAASLAENYGRARGIKAAEASKLLWAGPYTSKQAHEAGIVTDLATREQFIKQYAKENNVTWDKEYLTKNRRKSEPVNLFSLFSGVGSQRSRRGAARTQVALVYALGNIIDGVAEGGPFGGSQVIASEDFLELLDDIIKDGPPKALVVRVDSPGGSAVASDRIWNRLRQIRTEHDIPVVVSMGGVAASGGYYISMGADRIFADETTITGSIGVIMGGLLLGGTYDMIGVNKEAIGVGKHIGIMDETRRWEGGDLAVLERMRDEIYDTFTRQAAEGRGMTHEAILEVAEGRVWTGSQALQIGLIDEIGGLENAIASARRLAGIAADATVTVYPKEKSFFELLDELFAGQVSAGPIVRAWSGPVPGTWEHLATVLPPAMVTNARNLMTLVHTHPGQAILVAPTMFEIK